MHLFHLSRTMSYWNFVIPLLSFGCSIFFFHFCFIPSPIYLCNAARFLRYCVCRALLFQFLMYKRCFILFGFVLFIVYSDIHVTLTFLFSFGILSVCLLSQICVRFCWYCTYLVTVIRVMVVHLDQITYVPACFLPLRCNLTYRKCLKCAHIATMFKYENFTII